MTHPLARLLLGLLSIATLGLAASTEAAPEGRPPSPDETSYRAYCGGCHGTDATGAAAPDLTRLGARHLSSWADRIARGRTEPGSASPCARALRRDLSGDPLSSIGRRGVALAVFRYLASRQRSTAAIAAGPDDR